MENINEIKKDRAKVLIGLLLAILLILIFMLYKVITHIDAFQSDPLFYGAKLYSIDTCSCTTYANKSFLFNQSTRYSTSLKVHTDYFNLSSLSNITLTNAARNT